MNLRDLKYLVTLAEQKHFGKAANICNVSQPALSIQLQKLEYFLGVKLFERTNKKFIITAIGEEIVQRAKNVLDETRIIKEVAQQNLDPFSGKIVMGAFPTLSPYFFPKIITQITQKYLRLNILLLEEKTHILIEKLKKAEIDIAFLALPIIENQFECKCLFRDDFFLATASNSDLAKQKTASYDDIKKSNILLLEEGHCLRDQALDICNIVGTNENDGFRATSLETLRQMVAIGAGITLIPNIARTKNDQIKYLPFAPESPSRTIAMAWRKSSTKHKTFEELAKYIKKIMHK